MFKRKSASHNNSNSKLILFMIRYHITKRTSIAQTRAFAIIGPALYNQPPPSTRFTLLTGELSASFRTPKTALFSLGLSHGSASDWCSLQEALYKCIDTIQSNHCTVTAEKLFVSWTVHSERFSSRSFIIVLYNLTSIRKV